MKLVSLYELRKLEILAETFNNELYDTLTLKYTGIELDKKILELTNILPRPSLLTVDEVFDPAISSGEIGEMYSSNGSYDVLAYPDPSGHKDAIKIEVTFRWYFIKQLEKLNNYAHQPIDKRRAARLVNVVLLGKRSIAKDALKICFKSKNEIEAIKSVVNALHDDFDMPMYVIFRTISSLFPDKVTLTNNLSLVCHEYEGEKSGVQAHYDDLQISGRKLVDHNKIKQLVNKITTSPKFKDDHVAHCSIDNGLLVSKPVAQLVDPVNGKVDDCAILLVANIGMIINL